MDQQQVADDQDQQQICQHCGGTGLDQHWHGPFYGNVPKKHQPLYDQHLRARHQVLKLIDRRIAGEFLKLAKQGKTSRGMLEDLAISLAAADEDWADNRDDALRSVLAIACAAVWVLETEGYHEGAAE